MVIGYSYIIVRDFGFAPNPFHGFMTLATCKPRIRKSAKSGDYVMGFSKKELGNKLIFMMKVDKVIPFDEYWSNPIYKCKRPVMNGSLVKQYGDNIYHHDTNGNWVQEDSHHSFEKGKVNEDNLKRDTKTTDHVLVGKEFFYFGKGMITVPQQYWCCIYPYIGEKRIEESKTLALWHYLQDKYLQNIIIDDPKQFNNFKRYDGKS